MASKTSKHADQPWLAIFEFQSYSDAAAFATLVEEAFGDKPTLRRKNAWFNQGAFSSWRTTTLLRSEFGNRNFNRAMVSAALEKNGYSSSPAATTAWLAKATTSKVAERIGKGEYRWAVPIAVTSYTPSSQPFAPTSESDSFEDLVALSNEGEAS